MLDPNLNQVKLRNSLGDSVPKTIKYFVLSVDGGGVRGIIPAILLKEIEDRAGKPLYDLFDCIIGTSTGGLIALAMAYKFSSDKIINLYENESKNIFQSSSMHNILTGGGLWAPKYTRDGIDKILNDFFGEKMLSDAEVPVCITTYDLTLAAPKIWTSIDAAKNQKDDTQAKNVGAATSAAPTYFAPAEFKDEAGNLHYAVDGGIFLNNPTVLALLELTKNIPSVKADEIFVLSLGTGASEATWNIDKLKNAGAVGWIIDARIIEVMMNGNSDFANLETLLMFPNLFRLQINLPKELTKMDNATDKNIQELIEITKKYINEHSALLDHIAKSLADQVNMYDDVNTVKMLLCDEHLPMLVNSTLIGSIGCNVEAGLAA